MRFNDADVKFTFTGEKLIGQPAIDNARATGRDKVLLQKTQRDTVVLSLDQAEKIVGVKTYAESVWCWEAV